MLVGAEARWLGQALLGQVVQEGVVEDRIMARQMVRMGRLILEVEVEAKRTVVRVL